MYVGVDIGGSKTLIAVLDEHGVILEQSKFPTPGTYKQFLSETTTTIDSFRTKDFRAAGVAVPGKVDRAHGIATKLGNLDWHNVHLEEDFEKILDCPVVVENDANLAGLSEAMLLKQHQKVLYVTISTGIGTGIVIDRAVDPVFADSEGGQMALEYKGKIAAWEDFASGKAIVERFGKQAKDIDDAAIWRRIAHDWARGFIELIALVQPDVIVIGGSVGVYFDKYIDLLKEELSVYKNPMVPIPPIVQAQRPELAVVYGCYDLARSKYGHN